MGAENRAHTSHRIKKADTFVNRDEVVSKLRGTTRIESFSSRKAGVCCGGLMHHAHPRATIPLGSPGNGDDPGLSTSSW